MYKFLQNLQFFIYFCIIKTTAYCLKFCFYDLGQVYKNDKNGKKQLTVKHLVTFMIFFLTISKNYNRCLEFLVHFVSLNHDQVYKTLFLYKKKRKL